MSICLQSNGFSFSVTTSSGLLLSFGEVSMGLTQSMSALVTDIKSLFAELHIYPVEFKRLRLVVSSDNYVWVPSVLYDASQQRRYLETVSTLPPMSMVSAIYHAGQDAYLVFTSDANVLTAFKVALPGIECCAQPYALLSDAIQERAAQHPVVMAWIDRDLDTRHTAVDYLVVKEGRLLLSTHRRMVDEQQLLYTSIAVMKRMEVETADMELLLCGAVERDTFMHLRGYFPHIDLYNGTPLRPQHPQLARLHSYRYATILS